MKSLDLLILEKWKCGYRMNLIRRALFSMAMHIITYRIYLYKEEKFFDYLRDGMYN